MTAAETPGLKNDQEMRAQGEPSPQGRQESTSPGEPRRWDHRLLFAPLNTLAPHARRLAVVLATAAALAWSSLINGNMMDAWTFSDVSYYVLMAQNRYDLVPQPFSSRPLAPWLARLLSAGLHTWPEGGFQVLTFLCLLCALPVIFAFAMRTSAPRWMLLALAAVPFWPRLLGNAGVPDPLYTALLCCLLLCLDRGHLWVGAALMLPLMLTRESTSLTLFCYLAVAWRRLRWSGCALAIGAAGVGSWWVRRVSAGSLPNPEHLSGTAYMVGKLLANTARSVGLQPWSNVYSRLCPTPAWQHPLHLGSIRAIGLCPWSPVTPMLAWWNVLTLFGALPILLLCVAVARLTATQGITERAAPRRRRLQRAGELIHRACTGDGNLLLRFCLLYGGMCLVLAPMLGVSYTRLVGYAWPLLLVGLPILWGRTLAGTDTLAPAAGGWLGALVLLLHLLLCAVGLLISRPSLLLLVFSLEAGLVLLLLPLRGRPRGRGPEPGPGMSAC